MLPVTCVPRVIGQEHAYLQSKVNVFLCKHAQVIFHPLQQHRAPHSARHVQAPPTLMTPCVLIAAHVITCVCGFSIALGGIVRERDKDSAKFLSSPSPSTMAGLPIPAEAELDQIFGGSEDEDDNTLLPLTRTATASDLLDEEFPNSSDDKEGSSLLMDVLVQRPTSTEEEHAEEEKEKTDGDTQQLSSVKSERKGSGSSTGDRRYGLRDRRMTRKRPPQDAAVFGEDHPPRKASKENSVEQMGATGGDEEGEMERQEEEEEEEEDEEDSDSDAVYCICRQRHDGR